MPADDRAADDGAEAREPRRAAPPACARRLVDHARGDAGARRHPGDPAPGLGRRLGRSRAARPYDGGDDRRRRSLLARRAHAGRSRARARRAAADRARPEGRARAAQRHAVLDRARRWPACSRSSACSRRRWSPARCRPTRHGLRHAVRSAHPRAARPSRPDRGRRGLARADGRQPHPRLASRRSTTACRIPTACAASRR